MAYAQITDVETRIMRELTTAESDACETLLEDAAILIDSYNASASEDIKKVVSCRVVIRAFGDGQSNGVPIGASQGSISAGGYSQSWTMGGGSTGELYLSKTEKHMLGGGSKIGSYSPVEELVPEESND